MLGKFTSWRSCRWYCDGNFEECFEKHDKEPKSFDLTCKLLRSQPSQDTLRGRLVRAALAEWEGPLHYSAGGFNVVADWCKIAVSFALSVQPKQGHHKSLLSPVTKDNVCDSVFRQKKKHIFFFFSLFWCISMSWSVILAWVHLNPKTKQKKWLANKSSSQLASDVLHKMESLAKTDVTP